jgi:AraC-like DNA-binding protein
MNSLCSIVNYTCAGPQPGFIRPEETYTNFVLLGVEMGSFDYGVGELNGQASFGDAVIVPPGVPFRRVAHGNEISFHMFTFTIQPGPDGAPELLHAGKTSLGDVNRLTSNYAYLRKAYQEGNNRKYKSGLYRHMLMDLLHLCEMEWENKLSRKKVIDPLMQNAAGYIHRNLFGSLSMQQLATSLGIKQSELTRRFRLAYDAAPIEYATRLRLEEVKRLLRETNETLDTIATRCGYENGSYLSRVFSAKVGITPSAFRKYNQH